ncbi:hypothetical protein C9I43_10055 [Shewanella morhuae]|uniref:Uncharacterized protein n=1 Tax=Shewanella morhuae TaxID=365591 RepID=A0ABX5HVC9_9GAMM|nr:hypothetical protein C9I43_10055 [Shewanella morhuae]
MATRFIQRLRLLAEHHYVFNPSPCLKRVELPLNEQIVNAIVVKYCFIYLFFISRTFKNAAHVDGIDASLVLSRIVFRL